MLSSNSKISLDGSSDEEWDHLEEVEHSMNLHMESDSELFNLCQEESDLTNTDAEKNEETEKIIFAVIKEIHELKQEIEREESNCNRLYQEVAGKIRILEYEQKRYQSVAEEPMCQRDLQPNNEQILLNQLYERIEKENLALHQEIEQLRQQLKRGRHCNSGVFFRKIAKDTKRKYKWMVGLLRALRSRSSSEPGKVKSAEVTKEENVKVDETLADVMIKCFKADELKYKGAPRKFLDDGSTFSTLYKAGFNELFSKYNENLSRIVKVLHCANRYCTSSESLEALIKESRDDIKYFKMSVLEDAFDSFRHFNTYFEKHIGEEPKDSDDEGDSDLSNVDEFEDDSNSQEEAEKQ